MNKLIIPLLLIIPGFCQAESIIGKTLQMAGEHAKYVAVDKATDTAIDKATDTAKEMFYSETIQGKAVTILDGDTIDVLSADQKLVRIRLDSIDAPEKSQPFGQKAKETLTTWVGNQPVRVEVKSKDKYGRMIGVVYLENVNINRTLVQKGLAFAYEPFLKDEEILKIQAKAQAEHVGIWSIPDGQIVKPWDYRKSNH
jgi:endonuclease YncB( thermonuclease family)